MERSFKISCRVLLAVSLVAAVFLAGCGVVSRGGGTPLNPTKPTIVYESPYNHEPHVERNSSVVLTFGVQMDPSTLNGSNISLIQGHPSVAEGGILVPGTFSTDNFSAVFTPDTTLTAETTFFVTVTTGVKTIFGVAMASPFISSFTTGNVVDITTPEVVSTDPASFETGVRVDKELSVLFTEDMLPTTANSDTFILRGPNGAASIEGLVNCVGHQVTFDPLFPLALNSTYEATITTGLKCTGGVGLVADYVWTFETVSSAETTQDPVDLKTAGHFAVLANSQIQNTGGTFIDGPGPYWGTIGVSGGYTISGFPPGTFTGNNPTGPGSDAGPAHNDLNLAYGDAQGRSTGSQTLNNEDVGGDVFTPGLYTRSGSLKISSGNLTFNGQGSSDAVFIVQVSGNLSISNNRSILLENGAQAKNIFWQVGGAVTIGTVTPATTGTFNGIILANSDITVNSGSSVGGRVLTLGGVVYLNNCTITAP